MGRHHSVSATSSSCGSGSSSSTTTATTTTATTTASYCLNLPRRPSLVVEPAVPICQPHCLPRAQSTRMQLQRQRLHDQHAAIFIHQRLPGLKTSTTFFASLRTNLQLNASPPSSPLLTPTLLHPFSTNPLTTSSSPLSGFVDSSVQPAEDYISIPRLSTPTANGYGFDDGDPLAGVPELKSYISTTPTERYAAARLIFDGAVQMRRTADSALLFHPITLIATLAFFAIQAYILDTIHLDTRTQRTISLISLLGLFLLSRQATRRYYQAAQLLDIEWLDSTADDVLITRFGNEVIAALAIAWLPTSSSPSGHRRRSTVRGEIRAWTVGTKFRAKGVGMALLDEAVREARKRGATDLDFAVDHAYSTRVLPRWFNGKFDRREQRAHLALAAALDANAPLKARRRRGGST